MKTINLIFFTLLSFSLFPQGFSNISVDLSNLKRDIDDYSQLNERDKNLIIYKQKIILQKLKSLKNSISNHGIEYIEQYNSLVYSSIEVEANQDISFWPDTNTNYVF